MAFPNWFSLLILVQCGFAIGILVALFFISAPYGKHNRKGWGPALDARWAWMGMEFPATAIILIFYLLNAREVSLVNWVFLVIWQWHYINRTFVFSSRLLGARLNFPLSVASMAILFNLLNGTINGYYLTQIHPNYSIDWLLDPRFIGGTLLFFSGWILNVHSDRIIRNIRLRKPIPGYYEIPTKGLFRWITNPNYLGEILEWTGWAILTWSVAGLAFAMFTLANLLPRAVANHRWYRNRFPDYPSERKILIPGLF